MKVKEVFAKMRSDNISLVAKSDYLITSFGENYLKKHKREQLNVVCSNKMRELSRLLIQMRDLTQKADISLADIINPIYVDAFVESAKRISGYDPKNRTYRSASLAAHVGTSLKQICDIYIRHILKGDFAKLDKELEIKNVKRFKQLVGMDNGNKQSRI